MRAVVGLSIFSFERIYGNVVIYPLTKLLLLPDNTILSCCHVFAKISELELREN